MPEMFAEVAVFSALERTLHYLVPDHLQQKIQVGSRVLVPLARREAVGLVIALQGEPPEAPSTVKFRPVMDVLDPSPVLSPDLIALCLWLSKYYFYPLGETIQAALPSGAEASVDTFISITPEGRKAAEGKGMSAVLGPLGKVDRESLDDFMERLSLSRNTAVRKVRDLEKQGFLSRAIEWRQTAVRPKMSTILRLAPTPPLEKPSRSDSPQKLMDLLEKSGGAMPRKELRHHIKNADYWIRKLVSEGALQLESVEEIRESHHAQILPASPPHELTQEQTRALEAVLPHIEAPSFKSFLLFGVTGSGKTEVYLRLISETLKRGKGSLVLVPEITLSSQMEAIFRRRFGADLAVCHSGLSSGSRLDQWREALSGRRKVILGVRSAVFMPVQDLGLIIVDEEHDSSYKQEDHLRYNARDAALMRAKILRIPIVLGSATPSMQTVHQARQDRYTLLPLPHRIHDRPLPELQVVDMRRESRSNRILSKALKETVVETIEAGDQALLFLNRRGFANFILCKVCGHVPQCTHCSVSLTYHQKADRLRCHYCGWERTPPDRCPACDHPSLTPHGFGTERLEEEIRRLLPGTGFVRIDRDTVDHSRRMVEYLNAVRQNEAKLLLGTQMITKGHDFPNITLVGVINADTALQIPDYRAGETTVQTLMQVAGRAGRGEKPGRAILQTYNPAHYTIEAVVKMDYMAFCLQEMESREQLQYPPFAKFLKLLITAISEEKTQRAAEALGTICRQTAAELRSTNRHIAVLGPSPAPLTRLSNRYRWQIFAKAWTNSDMQDFIDMIISQSKGSADLNHVLLSVDRDPLSSL